MRKQSHSAEATAQVEVLTLIVAVLIYGGLLALTLCFQALPRWLVAVLGTLLLTWYGSLQHETIHGHPTPWRRANSLLGALPLTLWIPYALYRESHLRHHRHEGRYLTDVDRDPESFYWLGSSSARQTMLTRAIAAFNCTLVGRLLVGPAWVVGRFWVHEISKIYRGVGQRRVLWARHALGLILVFGWLTLICHVSLTFYITCLVYPSVSLGLLRSFAEHRADIDSRRRTRAVEAGPFWSLIFLNNNLHIAHHAYPRLAWYQLPGAWSDMRDAVAPSGLVITGGYLEVTKRYSLRSVFSMKWADSASTDLRIRAGAQPWKQYNA